MAAKKRVLFLCTGNSCRSQMAEAWARHLHADVLEAYSAGVEVKPLDPRAVRAMAEVGIDISGQRPKLVDEVVGLPFDLVVTLCGHAQETCPVFPGKTRRVHRGFDDPPALASAATTDEEAMAPYRRVRDQIREFMRELPEMLWGEGEGQRQDTTR